MSAFNDSIIVVELNITKMESNRKAFLRNILTPCSVGTPFQPEYLLQTTYPSIFCLFRRIKIRRIQLAPLVCKIYQASRRMRGYQAVSCGAMPLTRPFHPGDKGMSFFSLNMRRIMRSCQNIGDLQNRSKKCRSCPIIDFAARFSSYRPK